MVFSGAALVMSAIGPDELAAQAIALQICTLAYYVPLGIGSAATLRVGPAYCRGDFQAIAIATWTPIALSAGFTFAPGIGLLLFGPAIVGVFLDRAEPANQHAFAVAARLLRIGGLFQVADGAQTTATQTLRGLNDTTIPMLIAFGGYWLISAPLGSTWPGARDSAGPASGSDLRPA